MWWHHWTPWNIVINVMTPLIPLKHSMWWHLMSPLNPLKHWMTPLNPCHWCNGTIKHHCWCHDTTLKHCWCHDTIKPPPTFDVMTPPLTLKYCYPSPLNHPPWCDDTLGALLSMPPPTLKLWWHHPSTLEQSSMWWHPTHLEAFNVMTPFNTLKHCYS